MKSKKIAIIFVVFLALFVVFLSFNFNKDSFGGQIKEQPKDFQEKSAKIKISPSSFNFGKMNYGDVAEKIFIISNEGNAPLEILRVSTSCGCTEAKIKDEREIIPPGENAEMLVSFNPAIHEYDSSMQNAKRIVYVRTNDKNNPEIEIEITANVIK